jgi:hypothetical protein
MYVPNISGFWCQLPDSVKVSMTMSKIFWVYIFGFSIILKYWKYFSNKFMDNWMFSVTYRKIRSIDTNLHSENASVLQYKLCIVQYMSKVKKYFCEVISAHDMNCIVPRCDLPVIFHNSLSEWLVLY